MSAYGPALFVSRKDGAELSQEERAVVFRLVQSACLSLMLTDDEGEPVRPSDHGYDQEEEKALGVLLHSSYAYAHMPQEIQVEKAEEWEEEGKRVAAEVEKHAPGVYAFTAYGVEV
ncbi:hypothetical protein SZN_23576 [Streptomyces zinciresistens K42]|uniref:Uncharacterized protein n=1 Tax=Streptomyces zinciresistens K42 TaxID=700597 RepID=G2GGT1_9ACTN|nr:hypothetical protein SZN_23576 [Streptomyces zinciresistens K42]